MREWVSESVSEQSKDAIGVVEVTYLLTIPWTSLAMQAKRPRQAFDMLDISYFSYVQFV